jgi:hypothetical protein
VSIAAFLHQVVIASTTRASIAGFLSVIIVSSLVRYPSLLDLPTISRIAKPVGKQRNAAQLEDDITREKFLKIALMACG